MEGLVLHIKNYISKIRLRKLGEGHRAAKLGKASVLITPAHSGWGERSPGKDLHFKTLGEVDGQTGRTSGSGNLGTVRSSILIPPAQM